MVTVGLLLSGISTQKVDQKVQLQIVLKKSIRIRILLYQIVATDEYYLLILLLVRKAIFRDNYCYSFMLVEVYYIYKIIW